MATDYQDVLDSPKEYDGQQSFIGGVNSFDAPELIAPNAISYAENMDISFDGKIKTRAGTQLVSGPGTYPDYYALNTTFGGQPVGRVLAITQFNPLKLNGASNYVYTAYSGDPGAAPAGVNFVQYDPNNGWIVTNTNFMPGANAPSLDFMSGGNTLYATWGAGLYKLTSIAGAPPIFSLSVLSGSATGFPNLCPNAQFGTIHRNRMVVWGNTDVGSSDQDISVSAILAFENFDLVNRVFQAGTIDEGPVTCCQSWFSNNLLVFKQRAIYVVDTTDPVIANWPIQLVTRSVGCVARNSVRLVGNDVFFLAIDGVYSIGRVYAVESQAQVSPPVSRAIGNVFATLPLQNITTTQLSYATTLGNKYFLCFPALSTTRCDTTVSYNLLSNVWDGKYTFNGYNPQCFGKVSNGIYIGINHASTDAHPNFGNIWQAPGAFVTGTTNAYVATDHPNSYTAEANFAWQFISRSSVFGSSTSPKKGCHALFYADAVPNSTTNVTHQSFVDGAGRDTIQTVTIPNTGQARKIADMQNFDRVFALQHKLSGTGPASFKGVGAAAWLEATPREL